jgi:uncharacterized hydrophobic protein (TIGR00271 family)
MSQKTVPDYAHVVVVPIANPQTAPELIQLAEAFVRRDGGRVIALAVTLGDGDAEGNRERLDELEEIVAQFQPEKKPKAEAPKEGQSAADQDAPAPETPLPDEATYGGPEVTIDFVTHNANNTVARGILDVVRESGAELILLGVQQHGKGEVRVGVVAQSVMSAAPCDVLVYRYSTSPEFNRILVPVDGSPASRMAVRMGILFGNAYKGCPVEAIHIKSNSQTEATGRSLLTKSIADLPGGGTVKQTLRTSHSIADAILSKVDENHLLIMGFSRRGDLEQWLEGESPSRKILDQAPGPVLLAVRSTQAITAGQRLRRRWLGWVRPTLTDVEQEQIVWTATSNADLTLDYVVLMVVSAMLASLGLLLNSAAVIIGAMLVAPLMSPLTAFAIGLATARFGIMRQAFVTALAGFLIASVVGIVMGLFVPLQAPTPEMMGRVSPTLLDAFVALASGVAGSYATARRDIPAALAGVAIAAALVPPICTFGLQVAFGNGVMGLGAALLFLTNIVSIVVIATIVFLWLGLYPRRLNRTSLLAYVPIVILVALSLPMVIALLNISQEAQVTSRLEVLVGEVFVGLQVDDVTVEGTNPAQVQATLFSPYTISPAAVQFAEERIRQETGSDLRLQLRVQELVTSEETPPLPDDSPFIVANDTVQPASSSAADDNDTDGTD